MSLDSETETPETSDPPERNYLRAWREYRRMSQGQLAEALGTTGGTISLLESGQRKLSPTWLRRIAPVLNTTPGNLLEHAPDDAPAAILDVWAGIPDDRKELALRVLEAFPQGQSNMAKRATRQEDFGHTWFLRDWMKLRGKKQADLVADLGWSKAKAFDVWHGQQYTQAIIDELAPWLELLPHELLMRPDDAMALRTLRQTAAAIAQLR